MGRQLNELTRQIGEMARRSGGVTAAEVASEMNMHSRLASSRLFSALRAMDLSRAVVVNGDAFSYRYFGTKAEAEACGPPTPKPKKAPTPVVPVTGPYRHSLLELPQGHVSNLSPADCRPWARVVAP